MKHSKLNLMLIFLVFTVLFGLGFFLNQMIKEHLISYHDGQLIKGAQLLMHEIVESGGIGQVSEQQLAELSQTFQIKSTLLTDKGKVVFDSNGSTDKSSKLSKLLTQESNETILKVNDKNTNYYRMTVQKEGKLEGYLIVRSEMAELEGTYRKIRGMLFTSFCFAFIIISFIGSSIIWRMLKPIDSALLVIQQLTRGNYRARSDDYDKTAASFINQKVDQLARKLQKIAKTSEVQKDRLYTLVENMGSGLIFIDERGFIRHVNQTYVEVFQIEKKDYLNRPYYEILKLRAVNDVIEEVFMTERKVRRQMILPLTIERRHFEVYGAPIIGGKNTWKGILLVFHDITELKHLELMRKDFVANVSHELKTPVTSIKGFSETLLEGAMYDEKALHSFLSIILKESDRLQSLLQDLLDLSKIEHDEFVLNKRLFPINDLLQEIFLLLKEKAKEKQIKLAFYPADTPIYLLGDTYRLKQVFINLISNAIAYTLSGGSVTIRLSEESSHVIVKITDTGIGMRKEELPRIFERFYRIDKARSRESGGTGLGLAIVKHLVEAHDGAITVQSVVGKGTEFIVKLPKQ